jgi:hypothetical protein
LHADDPIGKVVAKFASHRDRVNGSPRLAEIEARKQFFENR